MYKRIALLIFLIVLIPSVLAVWWIQGSAPVDRANQESSIFVIHRGENVRQIGNRLKQEGFIRDSVLFFIIVKKNGDDTKVQAGDYRLAKSMNLSEVIESIKHGSLDKWVTFHEGKRSEEYAQILESEFPQYDNSWRMKLKSKEGFLFPDTYLIPTDANIDTILSIFENNFQKKIKENFGSEIDITNSARLQDVITLASLLEREGRNDLEREVIAGILQNRLKIGMALQVDATVQYAKGYSSIQRKWWPVITRDDYRGVVSPYNTYLRTGFPPGPIANPGISSIRAAINPKKSSYLYYLHDINGNIYYAKTLDEHNANVERYIQ